MTFIGEDVYFPLLAHAKAKLSEPTWEHSAWNERMGKTWNDWLNLQLRRKRKHNFLLGLYQSCVSSPPTWEFSRVSRSALSRSDQSAEDRQHRQQ